MESVVASEYIEQYSANSLRSGELEATRQDSKGIAGSYFFIVKSVHECPECNCSLEKEERGRQQNHHFEVNETWHMKITGGLGVAYHLLIAFLC